MEVGEKLGQLLSRKEKASSLGKQLATSCRQFFTQKVEFHTAKSPDSHLEHLKARYTPLNRVFSSSAMEAQVQQDDNGSTKDGSSRKTNVSWLSPSQSDGVPEPKTVLFKDNQLVMGWKESRSVGSGLFNLGNTCFLNSVLQCLTYTPPLFNYISSGEHSKNCKLAMY